MKQIASKSIPLSKRSAPPAWVRPGRVVHYHAVIGGPITERFLQIQDGPQLLSGHTWVVWLVGKAGCVSIDAISPAPEAA